MTSALSSGPAPVVVADHERRTWAVAALNALAMAVLVAGGLALNSAAVLAEGLHMSAHLGALAIGAGAYRVAVGLRARGVAAAGRVVDLAGLANALLLMLVAGFLTLESLGDLRHPSPIDLPEAITLAVFGLAVNVLSLLVLHRAAPRDAARRRDLNFRAIYLHMLGDVGVGLTSIAGLLLVRFAGWRWADGVAGLMGAALLAVLSVQIATAVIATNIRSGKPPMRLGASPAPSCRS
jgi:cation diffusion facilitator family transporter